MDVEFIDSQFLNEQRKELFQLLSEMGINEKVLSAMAAVPRELFMPEGTFNSAYVDRAFSIPGLSGYSSISQPYVVAKMIDALDLQPRDSVLELGTATGYQAAVLAFLAGHVSTIESIETLALSAKVKIESLGLTNVDVIIADGSEYIAAPNIFDKLIVTASVPPDLTTPLFNVVRPGGRIVIPVGGVKNEVGECTLFVLNKLERGFEVVEALPDYQFVPLLGNHGWGAFLEKFMAQQYETFVDQLFLHQ